MARFHLTIDFDDEWADRDGTVMAEMAASVAANNLRRPGITIEHVELTDAAAVVAGYGVFGNAGLTHEYLEWCETDEANEVDA